MNENPEGTPNPLNPQPAQPAAPAEPVQPVQPAEPVASADPLVQPAEPVQPVQPVQPVVQPAEPVQPVARPVQPVQPVQPTGVAMDFVRPAQPVEPVQPVQPAQPVQPMQPVEPAQPVAKDSIVRPAGKKKMKTGVLVGIILIAVAAVLGIAAAIVMIVMNNQDDRVNQAVTKVLEGNAPTNVGTNGTLNLYYNGEDSDVSAVNIQFNSVQDNKANSNSVSATVTATMANDAAVSFDFNGVKVNDGDLFIRFSGVAKALEDAENAPLEAPAEGETPPEAPDSEANCAADETGATNCLPPEEAPLEGDLIAGQNSEYYNMILGVLELVDGEWIRIPATTNSEAEAVEGEAVEEAAGVDLLDNSSTCLLNAFDNLTKYGNSIATLYKQNPFITYSTDNLKIAQKANPLYRLGFDTTKLTAFENSLNSAAFANDMLACVGGLATGENLDKVTITEIFADLPTVYVEIDNNYNFTRLYVSAAAKDAPYSVTADLNLSYPAVITVSEPDEYVNITDILSDILMRLYFGTTLDDSAFGVDF